MKLPAPVPWWKLVVHKASWRLHRQPAASCGWYAEDLQTTTDAEQVTCPECLNCMAEDVADALAVGRVPTEGWWD